MREPLCGKEGKACRSALYRPLPGESAGVSVDDVPDDARNFRVPVLFSLPPIDSQRYFRNVISARADGERVMEFFRGDVTNIARHQEAYNLAVMKAALENGCPFIDFRTDMLLMPDYLACLSDDGIHPNARGHEEIARIVGGKLTPSETAERLPVSPAAHGGQAAERSKAT